ncbi:hypothetical protein K1719_018016 [Acacia pycnantha]|nr:hypothetical protein K1719_018016 [Acacia pycnantha]
MLALQRYIVEEARHEGETTYNRPTTSDESTMRMGRDMTREEEEHIVEEMTLLTLKKTHNMERRHLLMWMVVLAGNRREFVDMHHYFLTREELQCLTPRSWINNKLMTIVAKTLVADELENGGVVKRHIFTASFMEKMINPKLDWTVEANVGEILPENVGYNIGDCDFIFGPTLFINHWFCYVLDTRTMVFYALDSLVEHRTYYRMQHEKENPTLKTTKKKKKTVPV